MVGTMIYDGVLDRFPRLRVRVLAKLHVSSTFVDFMGPRLAMPS